MAPAFTPRKMEFAARLKAARKNARVSQERAAAAVGTSRRHWIRWESGETSPNPAYLKRISEVLGDPSLVDCDADEEEEPDLVTDLVTKVALAVIALQRSERLVSQQVQKLVDA